MTWHVIRVRSKDAQKQLARTSLRWLNRVLRARAPMMRALVMCARVMCARVMCVQSSKQVSNIAQITAQKLKQRPHLKENVKKTF